MTQLKGTVMQFEKAKRLDQKDKLNFKFCDVTAWLTINFETHIAQYLEK